MQTTRFLLKPLAAVAMLAAMGAAQANITFYNTQASFLAAISAPGVDTYNDLPLASAPSPFTRAAGAYGYNGSVDTTSFYQAGTAADVWLSTNTATDSITFNAFTGGVAGVGGNFFGSDISGSFFSGDIVLTATDASGSVTQTLIAPTSTSFVGFVSDTAMVSLNIASVQPAGGFLWPTVNNLTLGAAVANVPEPETYAMMLAGLAFVGFMARRRRG